MKKTPVVILVVLLVVSVLLQTVQPVFADGDNYMAYNFYSNPVLSGTSGKFRSFMIDLRGVETPYLTYWSLCNFNMYLGAQGSRTQKAYPKIQGYGAYCGLQNRAVNEGKAGIISFWEATYQAPGSTYNSSVGAYMLNGEKVLLRATRVYPEGSSTFGGEGEGTNCIAPYEWQTNEWYTMLLHSWTDAQTGTTFVGEWFRDVRTGEWTLFSYFDTHLYDSYLTGSMSQFQENYVAEGPYNYHSVRSCNLKNMYALDIADGEWKSLDRSLLSYGNGGADNKAGAHSFGKSSDEDGEFWWASTGGTENSQTANNIVYQIDQPAYPAIDSTATVPENVQVFKSGLSQYVNWTIPASAFPQIGYTLRVYDVYGNLLLTKHETRPEVRSVNISEVGTDAVRCEVEIENIFNESTAVSSASSREYDSAVRLGVSTVSAERDREFSLPVTIAGNTGFNGADLDFSYDPEWLEFVSACVNAQGETAAYAENGTVHLSYSGESISSDGEIASLVFRALKTGKTTVTPCLSSEKGVMLNGRVLPSFPVSGDVTVVLNDSDFGYVLSGSAPIPGAEKLNLSVGMVNAQDIYGFSIEVDYDKDKLAYSDYALTDKFPYGAAVCREEGKVRLFACTEVNSPAVGKQKMASLTFDLLDPAAVNDEFVFTVSFYNNEPAYTLDEDKHIVKLRLVYTNELRLVVSDFDPYDLDRSGSVNIQDVTALLNYLSGVSEFAQGVNADISGNGTVSIQDVTVLLNILSNGV